MHKRIIKKEHEIKRISENLKSLFNNDLINKFNFGFIAKSINENKKVVNLTPKNIIKFYPCLLETLILENLMLNFDNDLTVTDLIINTHKYFQDENINILNNTISKLTVFKLINQNESKDIQKVYLYNIENKVLRHVDVDKNNKISKFLNINTAFGRLNDISFEVNPEKLKIDNTY
jgi:hypothetical protein